jgi:hypothetical protein
MLTIDKQNTLFSRKMGCEHWKKSGNCGKIMEHPGEKNDKIKGK